MRCINARSVSMINRATGDRAINGDRIERGLGRVSSARLQKGNGRSDRVDMTGGLLARKIDRTKIDIHMLNGRCR
jgi:hypothetical protein